MKTSRTVKFAMFAMVVFGSVETAFADVPYSFTTINVPGAVFTGANRINDSGQIVGHFNDATGGHGFVKTGGIFITIDLGAFLPKPTGSTTAARLWESSLTVHWRQPCLPVYGRRLHHHPWSRN